jgi:hypothetical protein
MLIIALGLQLISSDCSGQNWIQTSAPASNWVSIVSSQAGTKLAATVGGGSIYTSVDSGANWQESSATNGSWNCISSSADGGQLGAGISGGLIYISTNSGIIWNPTIAPELEWQAMACSSDGSAIFAGALSYGVGGLTTGPLLISTNSGASWNSSGLPNGVWNSIACSTNGATIVAVDQDAIYTSTNAGSTWATIDTIPQSWSCVACSADGTRQVAVSIGVGGIDGTGVAIFAGGIFISTNSGATWTQTTAPNNYWESVACSADGMKIVASAEEFAPATTLWISRDEGTTWQSTSFPDSRSAVASSGDGNRLFAALSNIGIYSWRWQPTLTMALSNQKLLASWPSASSGEILQHNSDLTTMNWVDLTNSITTTNGMSQTLISLGDGTDFYRVKVP